MFQPLLCSGNAVNINFDVQSLATPIKAFIRSSRNDDELKLKSVVWKIDYLLAATYFRPDSFGQSSLTNYNIKHVSLLINLDVNNWKQFPFIFEQILYLLLCIKSHGKLYFRTHTLTLTCLSSSHTFRVLW